jgi:hypothetical protein
MICAKALAVGPGKRVSVCTGQGDFENHCSKLYHYTFFLNAPARVWRSRLRLLDHTVSRERRI